MSKLYAMTDTPGKADASLGEGQRELRGSKKESLRNQIFRVQ
jgi:hypothetical protein